ncbi:class I SAM-dependent methyltransferase [Thiomicrorhabdus xiamenensis]|uniref:Class I SAM-dependent methyltransferase n=1 Tax=Thiomicrorhabdus xiamenensis TaxID=2739063 RepID=A0A7D4SHE8_9GAMM|nr:class I SAM-dependent methyltransferase [Thiomicrorhabdus xiamenensis]QKI88160.1 class I SAM-dependent methyltransferase [Thiomicrorhabdus xiamenensis]
MKPHTSSERLSPKQRLRIQTRHRVSIERFGYQPQALYWSSREIQQIRFDILSRVFAQQAPRGEESAFSVLDVGCGFADLRNYLWDKGLDIDYVGIDLSEDMVQSARFQYPDIQVQQGDLFDQGFAAEQFEFVLLSGALNEVVEADQEGQGRYAKAIISEMYRICSKGVAFNLLDARNEWIASRPDLQSFVPQEIVNYCQTFADRVAWEDGYLDNDFTVFLYKDAETVDA